MGQEHSIPVARNGTIQNIRLMIYIIIDGYVLQSGQADPNPTMDGKGCHEGKKKEI